MAGFEVVVRPVVFPNIRPQPARSLPPVNDPTQGFAEIHGNPAKTADVPYSFSASTSKSIQKESQRKVDGARIYQKNPDGTINRKNFIDVEVAKKIVMKGEKPAGPGFGGTAKEEAGAREELKNYYYRPVQEDKNIEVYLRDKVISNRE